MTKITKGLAIVAAVVALTTAGTYAVWTSVQQSTGNTFAGGELTLKLDKSVNMDQGSVGLFQEQSLAPGKLTAAKTLYFKNVGTVEGKVKLNVSYEDWDFSRPYGDVSADNFARNLQLVVGNTDGVDVTPYWTAQIISSYSSRDLALADMAIYNTGSVDAPTMYGLKLRTFYFENDASGTGANPIKWDTNAAHQSTFQFRLSPNAGNEYQGNGINATLTATMVNFDGSF